MADPPATEEFSNISPCRCLVPDACSPANEQGRGKNICSSIYMTALAVVAGAGGVVLWSGLLPVLRSTGRGWYLFGLLLAVLLVLLLLQLAGLLSPFCFLLHLLDQGQVVVLDRRHAGSAVVVHVVNEVLLQLRHGGAVRELLADFLDEPGRKLLGLL